jgi:polar amino acid transport system permease protein
VSFDFILLQLCKGFLTTFGIFALTLVFSLPLGLIVSFGRMSRIFLLRIVTKFYISVMRGTPLMLQLIVVYFGPYYLFGIQLGRSYRFTAVIIAFVLNYAAYFLSLIHISEPTRPY